MNKTEKLIFYHEATNKLVVAKKSSIKNYYLIGGEGFGFYLSYHSYIYVGKY